MNKISEESCFPVGCESEMKILECGVLIIQHAPQSITEGTGKFIFVAGFPVTDDAGTPLHSVHSSCIRLTNRDILNASPQDLPEEPAGVCT